MFLPIPNTTHPLRVIKAWANKVGASVDRGIGQKWHFELCPDLSSATYTRLWWDAIPDRETGKWPSIVVNYWQNGFKTHRLEFSAEDAGDSHTVWKLRNLCVLNGIDQDQTLNTRFLATVYSQTGEWFKSLEDISYRIPRPEMIHAAIWAKSDVVGEYLNKGISEGFTPIDGGWA